MRIAPNTTAVSMPAPVTSFHVLGMGSQFDPSAPYDGGYQIQPRWSQDIILLNGVENQDPVSISVFPNPTKGMVNVHWSEDVKDGMIVVSDMTGKTVIARLLNNISAGQVITLNLENNANGIYLVQVKGNNFQTTRKIVLNK
jgi:hypothetical protein